MNRSKPTTYHFVRYITFLFLGSQLTATFTFGCEGISDACNTYNYIHLITQSNIQPGPDELAALGSVGFNYLNDCQTSDPHGQKVSILRAEFLKIIAKKPKSNSESCELVPHFEEKKAVIQKVKSIEHIDNHVSAASSSDSTSSSASNSASISASSSASFDHSNDSQDICGSGSPEANRNAKVWAGNLLESTINTSNNVEQNVNAILEPSLLVRALTGPSYQRLHTMAVELKNHPAHLPTVYDFGSWIKAIVAFHDKMSDQEFAFLLGKASNEVKNSIANSEFRKYPIPFVPISIATIRLWNTNSKKALTSLLQSTNEFKNLKTKSERTEYNNSRVNPKIRELEARQKEQLEEQANLLYSQIKPAASRGFPYGFRSSDEFKAFSHDFLTNVKSNLAANLKLDEKAAFSIEGYMEGSSTTGLSFGAKGQGNLRRVISDKSDFDIAVVVPNVVFQKIQNLYTEFKQKVNTSKVRVPPFGETQNSSPPLTLEDVNSFEAAFLIKLGLFDYLKSLTNIDPPKRDVGIKFYRDRFERSMGSKETIQMEGHAPPP